MLKDADGKTINLGQASALAAGDWDRDGDIDLVAGFIGGQVVFLPNITQDGAIAFGPHVVLQAGGKPIPSEHAGPALGDWDLDGDLDLVVGSGDGSVVLYRASWTEKTGLPTLEPAVTLVAKRGYGDFKRDAQGRIEKGRSASRAKPCIADWNGDGKPDLLVGDFATVVGPAPVLTEEQVTQKADLEKELKTLNAENAAAFAKRDLEARRMTGIPEKGNIPEGKMKAWSDALRTLMAKEEGTAERNKRLTELREEVAALSAEREMTGFVWLYERK